MQARVKESSMKALYYPEWGKLEVRELPRPSLADGEVLVRVSNCGICGSELETFKARNQRRTPPLIMGHEFCGFIEEVRGIRSGWAKGSKVIVHALIHCGECAPCRRGDTNLCITRQVFGMHRPGAFAEYVAVPERVLISCPEDLPTATAVFAEPLANGLNAMRQGPTARKSRVVVIGAGPIGLMCALAAKHVYRSNVVVADLVSERLDAARMVGADRTVHVPQQDLAREARSYWDGDKAEFVIDAVGSAETKLLSLELTEPGGMAVWVGLHQDRINLDSYALTLGQKSVGGTYSGSMNDLRQAVQLLASGVLEIGWAKRYRLQDGEMGFREMLEGKGDNIKAILGFD
jgi:threonine dehydrogenase-like Zn-dependent dehydrogenase